LTAVKTYTEDSLTAALKKHDNDAFQYLYNNYKAALFTVVHQIITDKAIAQDVLQEAFITAWKILINTMLQKGACLPGCLM